MSEASEGELRGLKQEVEVGSERSLNCTKREENWTNEAYGMLQTQAQALFSFWWCREQQECLPNWFLVLCFCLPVASLHYVLLSSFWRIVVRFSCFWEELIMCKKLLKNKFFRFFLVEQNCSTGDFWRAKRQREIINWPCKRRLGHIPSGRCFSCV